MSQNQSSILLKDGNKMPQIGLGVWKSTEGQEIAAVEWAIEKGYRHIDTAAIYKNEEGVGQAIANSGIKRSDLFVTTKLWNTDIREAKARAGIETSLEKLKLDYVDLYLLHWPVDGGAKAWEELIRFQEEGLVKSIGVSNYLPVHLEKLIQDTTVIPAVNQVEFHPYHQPNDILEICQKYNIKVTAWSPLMQGKFKEEPHFEEIGKAYGKSAAQVILRWNIQKGLITIPKSANQNRINQNFEIFDFELSAHEMNTIDQMAKSDGRVGPHPMHIDF